MAGVKDTELKIVAQAVHRNSGSIADAARALRLGYLRTWRRYQKAKADPHYASWIAEVDTPQQPEAPTVNCAASGRIQAPQLTKTQEELIEERRRRYKLPGDWNVIDPLAMFRGQEQPDDTAYERFDLRRRRRQFWPDPNRPMQPKPDGGLGEWKLVRPTNKLRRQIEDE